MVFLRHSEGYLIRPGNSRGRVLDVYGILTGPGVWNQDISSYQYIGRTNQKWVLKPCEFNATVNMYFDNGYPIRYGETQAASRTALDGYMQNIAARYEQLFNLRIQYNNAAYFQSAIDDCKGTVTSSNVDTLCSHSGTIHTDLNNVNKNFNSSVTGSNTITNVYWSGHKIACDYGTGTIDYNRCCSAGTNVMMIEISSPSDRTLDSQGILMHELNHQYGAPDHYHEILSSGKCRGGAICSTCGTTKRPSSCIMYQSRINISTSTVICTGCQIDIANHLNDHH